MAVASNIQLYETLKQSLGNKQAEALVEFMDTKMKESHESSEKNYATKEDVKETKLELLLKISETKTDIIRWVFAFMIPLMLAIIGLYFRK